MESEDISEALDRLGQAIATGLAGLGNGNAYTPMGALEAHGQAILDAADNIASASRELSISIDTCKR